MCNHNLGKEEKINPAACERTADGVNHCIRKRILITGAGGRVGSALSSYLERKGQEIMRWGRCEMNFEDPGSWFNVFHSLEKAIPDVVINCAAVSSLETCLGDPAHAHKVNAMAPEALAGFCERNGVPFIHFSTDYVLDGRKVGLKSETAKCKPVNVYGESKWEAETRIARINPSAIVVRVSWIFGNAIFPSFPDAILQKALLGQPLAAIADKYSLPASLETICAGIEGLLDKQTKGVYHLCDSGEPASWHDYAYETLAAAAELGFRLKSTEIEKEKLRDITFFKDQRPIHTAMDNSKISSLLPSPIPSWKKTLREYLASLRDHMKDYR